MQIELLTPQTIGKIAAGEVVERPSSVVKELLENAIDAGARRIKIEIRGGGVDWIEIADDGRGMSATELAVAVQRHATSKLRDFEDLDSLTTLGFRGEALPSIGAVSELSIRSRAAGESNGAVIEAVFGEVAPVRAVAAPDGTTVKVRDLFGNVPARRKFLRRPSTEAGTIGRIVSAYAAAYPDVQFGLISEGRSIFNTDGSGDLVSAASGAFGLEVGQAAILLELLEPEAAISGVDVRGWVCAPVVNRSHRQNIVLFVNGRWIQNRQLTFAIEEAYHSLLMVGRHPVALIDVRLDPAAVDVNVHPTKAEVKFVDERSVFRAVQRTVHMALARTPRDELPLVGFSPISDRPFERQASFAPVAATDAVADGHVEQTPPVQAINRPALPMLRVLG